MSECKYCDLPVRETHQGNVRNEWEHMNGLSFCADGKHWAWPSAPPAPQGSGEHKLVADNAELRKEVERYLTQAHSAEGTAVYHLRLRKTTEGELASARVEMGKMRARLAEVEAARDQALTLGAEQVLEIQELRQVVQWYRSSEYDHGFYCWEPLAVGDFRCSICIKADALLEPKPTQQGDKE